MNRRVGSNPNVFRVTVFRCMGCDVFWNVNDNGARPTRTRDKECLLYRRSKILDIPHQEVVLNTRPGDADSVHFLEGIVPGERIVTAGVAQLREGFPIRLMER